MPYHNEKNVQRVRGVKRVAYCLPTLRCHYPWYQPMKIDIWQNRTLVRQIFDTHKVYMHTPFKFDYSCQGTKLVP